MIRHVQYNHFLYFKIGLSDLVIRFMILHGPASNLRILRD